MQILAEILTTVGGLLIFYVCSLPLILIHELGHFAAGSTCGLRLLRFRVGPVELARPSALEFQGPLRMNFSWKLQRWCSGRIVMVSPKTSLQDGGSGFWFYVLGGPLANLGCALLALPLALQDTMAGGIAKYVAIASFLLGAVNLFPFRKGAIESDGMQFWGQIFDQDKREMQMYRLTLAARLTEIKQLSEIGQLKMAANRTDELLRDDERVSQTSGNEELRRFLTAHRDRIQTALQSAEHLEVTCSQSTAQPVEQDATPPLVEI